MTKEICEHCGEPVLYCGRQCYFEVRRDMSGITTCHCGYPLSPGQTHESAHQDQCPECGYFGGMHNEGGCSRWRDTADYDPAEEDEMAQEAAEAGREYAESVTGRMAQEAAEAWARDEIDWIPF